MPKDFGSFFSPKSVIFRANLVEFRVQKGHLLFVPVDILRLSQSGYCILCTYLIFFHRMVSFKILNTSKINV